MNTQKPEAREELGEMCGIALIISGIRICKASSLFLDSVPPASSLKAEQVKAFHLFASAIFFYCFRLFSVCPNLHPYLKLNGKRVSNKFITG